MVYTQSQIREIVEYARLRGIRILVEFNTPAHSRSWGVSHPEVLTVCNGIHTGALGPIDPTKEETYTFVRKLLAEVISVFPDDYVHLGGNDGKFIQTSRFELSSMDSIGSVKLDLSRCPSQKIIKKSSSSYIS